MTATIRIQRVAIRDFRNLEALDFHPASRVNVLTGDNGQGKTSVLEALYFVATSRSFRTEHISEAVRQGRPTASVRIDLEDDGIGRVQRASASSTKRSLLLDGKRPESLSAYAVRTPVVVFHPGDLSLVSGPAGMRRTLLDRLALFSNLDSGMHRVRYRRAMRERQATLLSRGTDAAELAPFEAIMAEHGCKLTNIRRSASEILAEQLMQIFARTAPPGLALSASYAPGGCSEPQRFLEELKQRRRTDARRKLATFGPQRDDMDLRIDGRSVRKHASQGQQRILALSIKLAELEAVREVRNTHPILLLDDISSELDPGRAGAVYSYLQESESQVFVTTTRPELFATPGVPAAVRADFRLVRGALDAAQSRS